MEAITTSQEIAHQKAGTLSERLHAHLFEFCCTCLWFTLLPFGSAAQAFKQRAEQRGYAGHSWCITLHQYYYLPIVGALKALIAFGIGYGLAQLWHPAVAWALAAIIYATLSGGIHWDGYMDVIDALFASHNKSPYEVMRDPHVGALAVAYLLFLVGPTLILTGQWFSHLGAAFNRDTLWWVVTPFMLAKLNCFWILGRYYDEIKLDQHMQVEPQYSWWTGTVNHTKLRLTVLTGILAAWPLLTVQTAKAYAGLGILLMVAVAINCYCIPRLKRTLGFLNGDVFGCLILLHELGYILTLSLWLVRYN